MDLTELGWDSVNWIKKNNADLVVTVKAGGLTLAMWSWLVVTVNFGGLTLCGVVSFSNTVLFHGPSSVCL